jgi:thymidylate kinase
MKCIAVEGLDGSGKTTVAHALQTAYEAEGLSTQVVAPYRLANEAMDTDIYPLWKSERGALAAVEVLKDVLAKSTEQALDEGLDILIFDRHWMTAFTEIECKPKVVEAWGNDFIPTAYLRVDPETAQQRAQNDNQAAWMGRHDFNNYAMRYSYLCKTYGNYLLGVYRNDDDVSIEAITRSIKWDMNILR